MKRHWLIIYDIADNRRLQKTARLMLKCAIRVQKSVYEAIAEDWVIEKLRRKVNKIINPSEDFVVYYKLCSKDWQKQQKFGPEKYEIMEDKEYYIID